MGLEILVNTIVRCLLLDHQTLEEVGITPEDTIPALLVVICASFSAGLGGLLWTFVAADYADHLRFFVRSFLAGSALQIAAFFVWLVITRFVLRGLFQVQTTYGGLLRVMGYAFAPVALQLMIFIPALDQPIGILSLAATFYITTYAVQVTTDATPGQAFSACLLGFATFCAILGILGNGATDLAPGIFALDPNSLSVGLTLPIVPVKR